MISSIFGKRLSGMGINILLISIFFITGCASSQDILYPSTGWERIEDPASAGYTQEGIDAAGEYAKSINTTGYVVTVGGRILCEYGDIEELSYIASVRKSVLAMLFGNYVADGTVDLKKNLVDLNLDDIGGLSDQEREATIEDLISARSGVYHAASNAGDNLADAPERGSKRHGEYFLYSNWDFNALGFLFEQETGRNIYDAVQSDIAIPIGMQDFDRSSQRKSGNLNISKYPAYHMWFSTRDMARIGYLMLREGSWNGVQVIPRDWAKKISGVITPSEDMNPERIKGGAFGYGYLWWVFDGDDIPEHFEGAYMGMGYGGQYIAVIPELDMVAAHKVNLRKTSNRAVSQSQFMNILDKIISTKQ
ncbi:MAG: serine hydrolase [bacterium]|nr:serine hydrolase [bacterium]